MAEVMATAAQLSSVCWSLMELSRTIYGATSTLRKYNEQLEQLRDIFESISKDPHLQTSEIQDATNYVSSLIDQTGLKSVLSKPKYRQAFYLLWRRRALSGILIDLDRQKASLCLIIGTIHSRHLYEITKLPSLSQDQTSGDAGSSSNPQKALISGCLAEPGIEQHNGPNLVCTSDQLCLISDTTIYTNNTTLGGDQHNGFKATIYADEPFQFDVARLNGTHMNARALSGGDGQVLNRQHNGPDIILQTNEDRVKFGNLRHNR